METNFIGYVLFLLVTVYPVWRIFRRAGLNPALSLFVVLPGIGPLLVAYLLALLRWPNSKDS